MPHPPDPLDPLEYEPGSRVRRAGWLREWAPALMMGFVAIAVGGGAVLYCLAMFFRLLTRPILPGNGGP